MSEEVLVRTRRGRIHRATLTESGALRYDERCNLDDSEGEEIVDGEALANAEPGQLCENDFPDIPDDRNLDEPAVRSIVREIVETQRTVLDELGDD